MEYNKRVREQGETDLEQLHLVLLEMLRVIDAICRKHDIAYWLDAGNLLGKARHGGFIPWDDDIDLCMSRPDYERFIEVAPDELPKDLFFQYQKSDKRRYKWIKIRDKYSTVVQAGEAEKNLKHHRGIFVDIFPYDLLVEEFDTTKMVLNRKFKRSSNWFVRKFRFWLNMLVVVPVKLIGFNRVKKFYIKKHMGHNPSFVSTGLEISNFYFTFDHDTVFPLQEIEFEGVKTFAPNNIDDYLSKMYGDYMAIPPEGSRKIHAVEIMPFTKCDHPASLDY